VLVPLPRDGVESPRLLPINEIQPYQALFARIREGTPASISDDHVADALLRAKQAGITEADRLQGPMMRGDRLCMRCATPVTGWVVVNVSDPVPPMQGMVQQTLALNRQREQRVAMEAMQRSQDSPAAAGRRSEESHSRSA